MLGVALLGSFSTLLLLLLPPPVVLARQTTFQYLLLTSFALWLQGNKNICLFKADRINKHFATTCHNFT